MRGANPRPHFLFISPQVDSSILSTKVISICRVPDAETEPVAMGTAGNVWRLTTASRLHMRMCVNGRPPVCHTGHAGSIPAIRSMCSIGYAHICAVSSSLNCNLCEKPAGCIRCSADVELAVMMSRGGIMLA